MDALTLPYDPLQATTAPRLPFPLRAVGPFGLLFAAAAVAIALGTVPPGVGLSVAGAAFHGGLLSAALASAWGKSGGWQRLAWLLTILLFLAMLTAQLLPWGAFIYLLLPLALAALGARHPQLQRIGWGRPGNRVAWLLGAGTGLFLGAHLLLSASRTLGYRMWATPAPALLAALAYDAGANVPSAELFFRGVLFNFWLRRHGFWPAAVLSTAACLLRYAGDPALPPAPEAAIGALFYLSLLSLASCALFARFGSLLPSMLAGLFFFGAYRALQLW